jgi:hypothetical protein
VRTSAIFLKKKVPERIFTQNSVGDGEVLVISMPGKKVSERRFDLRPSEKELPKRRSSAFRHKNTACENHTKPINTVCIVAAC